MSLLFKRQRTSAGLRLPTIVIGVIPIIAVGLDQLRILQARKLAIVVSEIASINNLLPDNRDKRHSHDN
jgi:hypothetical protein